MFHFPSFELIMSGRDKNINGVWFRGSFPFILLQTGSENQWWEYLKTFNLGEPADALGIDEQVVKKIDVRWWEKLNRLCWNGVLKRTMIKGYQFESYNHLSDICFCFGPRLMWNWSEYLVVLIEFNAAYAPNFVTAVVRGTCNRASWRSWP